MVVIVVLKVRRVAVDESVAILVAGSSTTFVRLFARVEDYNRGVTRSLHVQAFKMGHVNSEWHMDDTAGPPHSRAL